LCALVELECDPDDADNVVPDNGDAIRSCSVVIRAIADAINAGKAKVTRQEMAAPPAEEPQTPAPVEEPETPATAEETEAPSAEEVSQDPTYEQIGAHESAGEEVASGSASPPVPAEASTERSE